jgi:C-terminal processing protease CtpA/Prc
VSPNQGSPAEKAGIQPGDALLSIGGKSTATMGLYDVASELQGPEGRSVAFLSTPSAPQRTNSKELSARRLTRPLRAGWGYDAAR